MRRLLVVLSIAVAALGPVTVRADDKQIADSVIEQLRLRQESGELRGFKIELQVDQGTVWLTGRVPNEQQQKLQSIGSVLENKMYFYYSIVGARYAGNSRFIPPF